MGKRSQMAARSEKMSKFNNFESAQTEMDVLFTPVYVQVRPPLLDDSDGVFAHTDVERTANAHVMRNHARDHHADVTLTRPCEGPTIPGHVWDDEPTVVDVWEPTNVVRHRIMEEHTEATVVYKRRVAER
jgi:hypothetical protein